MISFTDLVRNSERIGLSSGLLLLLPDGSAKQQIMMEVSSSNKRFANITAAGILQSPVWKSEHGSPDTQHCQVYLVAPGNWNDGCKEYYALVSGNGTTVMASLSSCGYETDSKETWQMVRQ